jgi:hypothetical protein
VVIYGVLKIATLKVNIPMIDEKYILIEHCQVGVQDDTVLIAFHDAKEQVHWFKLSEYARLELASDILTAAKTFSSK